MESSDCRRGFVTEGLYFTGNQNGLLLASDVAARGLDIPNVEHVIHYQVPHTVEVSYHVLWLFECF